MSPKFSEIADIGGFLAATVYDEQPTTEALNIFAATGLAPNKDLALCKALCEFVERLAFQDAAARGDLPGQDRSDGFAAFPRYPFGWRSAARVARQHALSEAIERFVWATWWDERDHAHDLVDAQNFSRHLPGDAQSLWMSVFCLGGFTSMDIVLPAIENAGDIELIIVLGFRPNGGVVTGGAAGKAGERNQTLIRALYELLRHELAARRMIERQSRPTDIYEKRLLYFASGEGSDSVTKRLRHEGAKRVCLPALAMDRPIAHRLYDVVAVHACRFEGQPPFIGGALDRLCL